MLKIIHRMSDHAGEESMPSRSGIRLEIFERRFNHLLEVTL